MSPSVRQVFKLYIRNLLFWWDYTPLKLLPLKLGRTDFKQCHLLAKFFLLVLSREALHPEDQELGRSHDEWRELIVTRNCSIDSVSKSRYVLQTD